MMTTCKNANTSVVMSSDNQARVVKEGWLRKQGEFIINWRLRYFILREDGTFLGFKSERDAQKATSPVNNFTVRDSQLIFLDDAKPFTFVIRGLGRRTAIERTFCVESEKEREDWTLTIRYIANKVAQAEEDFASSINELSTRFIAQKNKTLADFEFLTVLGVGTFGKVILCREKPTQNVCAIKIMSKKVVIKKDETWHILTENRVLQTINHPFLIAHKYSFQTVDRLFLVTEYANGGELFFHMGRDRVFEEDRAKFYGAEIISALGYLHSRGIIYRDVKLENLLLDKEGHIKIVDFGLCKENFSYGTTTKTFCGTPEYLAPEIIEDAGYDRAVDWWGLGVAMYEMMCGRLPFYNHDHEQLFTIILLEDVSFPDHIINESRDLLNGLLVKEPNKRLGGGPNDAKDIMNHPFFSSIDWSDLVEKKIPPPFKPQVTSDIDTQYFDSEFTSESVELATPNQHRCLIRNPFKMRRVLNTLYFFSSCSCK